MFDERFWFSNLNGVGLLIIFDINFGRLRVCIYLYMFIYMGCMVIDVKYIKSLCGINNKFLLFNF